MGRSPRVIRGVSRSTLPGRVVPGVNAYAQEETGKLWVGWNGLRSISERSSYFGGDNDVERVVGGGPRVLLISASQPGCATRYGDYVTMRALKNKMDYANRHGMDVAFALEKHVSGGHRVDGLHNKISVINRTIASRPDYDWYVWMDSDTIIADMDFEIPWSNYVDRSLVIWGTHTDFNKVVEESSYLSINSGVVFFRNTPVIQSLFHSLKTIWAAGFDSAYLTLSRVVLGMPPYASDQSTLMYLLATQPGKWRNEVQFVSYEYAINLYWRDPNVSSYTKTSWVGDGVTPPFVVHFCGCELCWTENEHSPECLAAFDKVYNFADDQVLAQAGLRHVNLSSPFVIDINRSTSL
ncbi:hypothetical protein CBR_g46807 [Chara braunii]|uniref:GT34-family glycosyltransferase n=1 Tax=Chara braunii TaxID=69332 RepID=A0A388M0Y9_CHABU|nr:hypothetical protein CBR_g46807 [Chara braunii]|eukprot:GBG88240.1 hypothetical protein CBR_g46807 [Chara braunii]